jgi:hypothetical protein
VYELNDQVTYNNIKSNINLQTYGIEKMPAQMTVHVWNEAGVLKAQHPHEWAVSHLPLWHADLHYMNPNKAVNRPEVAEK